ncbi:hypothetical protein GEMRC1_002262 [Eukaryota sp. GEM-RC1]
MDISTHSWMQFSDSGEEILSKSLRMTSDETVQFKDTSKAADFTKVELYNGEAEFSTGWPLKFNNLTIHGGRLYYSDNIEVDHFIWNCGEIEGFGLGTTISIRHTGSIGFCSNTGYLDIDRQLKDIIAASKLIFLPGSHLEIHTGAGLPSSVTSSSSWAWPRNPNYVYFRDSTSIVVQGTARMRTASFFSFDLTPVNRLVFEGPYTEAVEISTRRFYMHVVFNTPYHQYAGINIYHRFLDVYSDYIVHSTAASGPSSVQFDRPRYHHSSPFRYTFHQNSNYTEVIDCEMCTPTFLDLFILRYLSL